VGTHHEKLAYLIEEPHGLITTLNLFLCKTQDMALHALLEASVNYGHFRHPLSVVLEI